MQITSPAFKHNQTIPSKYICEEGGISPELRISNIPDSTKSLALIMDDPDAVSGLYTHWILFNIDPSTEVISEGRPPKEALEGQNSDGTSSYIAPCPPEGTGTHRYFFKIFALSDLLNLSTGITRVEVEEAMHGLVIDTAELVGLYTRG